MGFAREGYPFMAGATIIAIVTFLIALRLKSWPIWLLAFVLTIIAIWVAWFFRDPIRTGPRGSDLVIAPADGRVVLIKEVDEPSYVKGKALRVSIFMNVFSVHVNRYPVSGKVEFAEHKPGKFLNAVTEQSSLENEQASVGIDTGPYRILVRQIAGLIARRIITDAKPPQSVTQGERLGLIRFGSRVDLFLPLSAALHVSVGDHTKAGESLVAVLPATDLTA